MKLSIGILVVIIMVSGMAGGQAGKSGSISFGVPVYLSHEGKDKIGIQFVADLRGELSKSSRLRDPASNLKGQELRFYVDVSTLDVSTGGRAQSVASIVIEEIGLPNSYPVPSKWYHKVILLEPDKVGELASELLLDMDARWCRTIKNSPGGCPREFFDPALED